MFLNSGAVKEGLFAQQIAGYAAMINELENLMWPILSGDEDYAYELKFNGVEILEYPVSNDPQVCYKKIIDYDQKYKIIAKRFWRFGLMPIVPTSLNMITRTQKYDKFKQRIKAQAIKYLDLFGEDLIEHIRKKRDTRTPAELREADYSKIYRDFLKASKIDYDDLEEDVLAFVEEN
jgi:hypothetical protein